MGNKGDFGQTEYPECMKYHVDYKDERSDVALSMCAYRRLDDVSEDQGDCGDFFPGIHSERSDALACTPEFKD